MEPNTVSARFALLLQLAYKYMPLVGRKRKRKKKKKKKGKTFDLCREGEEAMTGKKQAEEKDAGKEDHKLNQRKIEKKWKEKVKFFGGLAAKMTAVQAELIGEMDKNLPELGSDTNSPNLQPLQLTVDQLRKVNALATLLNDEVEDFVDEFLDEIQKADQDDSPPPPPNMKYSDFIFGYMP
ncbi:uncharacterized protein LOC120144482 [Hibiscus syriacus]|uniref:uncharacterized protein LOC120144482 n=1 Tax=Hibiscus syriacus TaxID=106335 RepID=UPI0019212C3F|nr:uncharacterized protein LOC120144482 [Hibiscus syriacus]